MPQSVCDRGHDCPREWIQISPGKSVLRCPKCHAGEKTTGQLAVEFPKIKYGQQWFRDRPLTEKEKAAPPRTRSFGT